MVRSTLRELIELTLLDERIRSKGFNLSKFKRMDDLEEMHRYARDNLGKLGEGSARTAWVLSSGKALKIARHDRGERGRAQNKAEHSISTDADAKQLVARVLDHDPRYGWLISELVRPITKSDFDRATGIDFADAMYVLVRIGSDIEPNDETRSSIFDELQMNDDAREFIESIVRFKKKFDLMMPDIISRDHWGKTPSGRVVILDYGFTDDVYRKHYRDAPEPE